MSRTCFGKIAISNHRIKNIAEGKVTFSYKDYKHSAVTKEMDLQPLEFIRRFALHILPKGFVRIRHYGILSSTSKAACALVIKEQLPPLPEIKNIKPKAEIYNPLQCPCCKKETMQTVLRFNRRGPPADCSKWLRIFWNVSHKKSCSTAAGDNCVPYLKITGTFEKC